MKGIVYVIRAKERWDYIYIGSTFQTLKKRYKAHLKDFKKNNRCNSKFVFRQFGIANIIIETIKEYDVCDREHLEAYETLWIENFKDVVINQLRPFCIKRLSKKQYREKNREYNKQYYEKNREEINRKHKQQSNCDICGKQMRKNNISRHKKNIHFK